MAGHKEYFAESTEAFFSRNDFFPVTRAELEKHDPHMFAVLQRVWARSSNLPALHFPRLPRLNAPDFPRHPASNPTSPPIQNCPAGRNSLSTPLQ